MNTKKVLMGVLAGAATGAVFGVLFAPHKGKSTRKMILDKGESYLSSIEYIMDGYVSMINKKMESLKNDITDMSSNGKAKTEAALNDVINDKIK
ncbi:MAG: YtxH domain-containing protein [Saprospiraceae bacterium]|nr:YtxH domain-containing protein [Saprospiraceae bacterium]